jgi:hypothetical protein
VRLRLALCGAGLLAVLSACTSTPAATPPASSAAPPVSSATPAALPPGSATPAVPPASSAASEVPAVSAPPWTEPARYGFVLDRRCDGGPSMGRYRVSVKNGKVVRADRIDGRTAAGEEEIDVPSLAELLTLAQTAADDGGEVTTKFDATDGHPIAVSFNVSGEGTDGASCFTITEYRPVS